MNNIAVGILGEVSPIVIENFKIRMPVTSFELNLSSILNM
jgi:phenylalanyl-tRNA synthetase beta subunit